MRTYATSAFATKTDGTLWSWGHNGTGELGQNSNNYYSSPVQIPGTNWSADINCGGSFMMCSKTDSTLWSWGNNYGMLGLGDNARRSSPTQVPGTDWLSVAESSQVCTTLWKAYDG